MLKVKRNAKSMMDNEMLTVLNYLREVLSDIGAVLEFQVIGCDAIGQRNPGKYRNPGEEIGRKSGLGKSAKYRRATFTPSPKKGWRGDYSRNIGSLINHARRAKKVMRMFFLRQGGGANVAPSG